MLHECLRLLAVRPGEVVADGTLGDGGHTAALIEAAGEAGRVIGVDRDPGMTARARERLAGKGATLITGNFSDLDQHLQAAGFERADAILLDLGVASLHLDDAARGFSYRGGAELDMRMSADEGPSAADWLADTPEEEIGRVIREYGEERYWRRIARAITQRGKTAPIRTTAELAEIIRRAVPSGPRRLHPARRTFQAIRIAVNREIEHLEIFLQKLPDLLNPGGRCAIIAYHSLEDRPVKNAFRDGAREGVYELLTRKPLRPSAAEVARNPRSRSARLRAVRRAGEGGPA